MKTKVSRYINPYEASKEDSVRSDEDFDFALICFLVTEYCDPPGKEIFTLEEHIPLEEGKTKAEYIADAWALSKVKVEAEAKAVKDRATQLAIDLQNPDLGAISEDEVEGSDIDPETGAVV